MGLFKPDAPEAPNYAEANREGILTDLETLPLRRMIEAAARSGTAVSYTDPRTGETKKADFTGMGDADLSRLAVDFGIESADKLAKAQLDLSQKYGEATLAQRLKELEQADPEGTRIRKELGAQVESELSLGSMLDAATRDQVTEAERVGQSARGNILGTSAGAAEAMTVGEAGLRLKQQRQANAAAFLNGTTPTAQFGSISGAQQGPVAFTPANLTGGTNVNPNAGAQGVAGNLGTFNARLQAATYASNASPWTQLFDTFTGALTSAGGIAGGMYLGKQMGG